MMTVLLNFRKAALMVAIALTMFLSFTSISPAQEQDSQTPTKYDRKYFLIYQYVVENKEGEKAAREDEKEEDKTSRKKVTSFFKYWGKYGEFDSGVLPDEKQKAKFDKEGKWKPILSEKDTLCVPPCDYDADPKEKSYVKIFPVDDRGSLYEPMVFTCEMIGKDGYVGPISCAIEEVRFAKGEIREKDRVCLGASKMAYTKTETKVSEGVVEERDLAWTLDKDGKSMVQVPARHRYLGNRSRKEADVNRSIVDPCGFVHSICFDPFLGLGWDETQMCPCEEAAPPPITPPPPVQEPTIDAPRAELTSIADSQLLPVEEEPT